jgi:signal transduction histidine kinase/AmiR/NasT family two-component response regulator
MSFRLKTILGIAAIEATLLLLLVGSGLSYLRNTSEAALVTRAETSAKMFASAIKNAAMSSDVASLRSFFDEVATNRDLAYARLVDSNGRVFAEKQNAHAADERVVSAASNITEGSIDFGRVEIGFLATAVDHTIADAQRLFVGLAALEMLLVAGFSVLLGNYLTKRLRLLQSAAEGISRGDFAGIDYRGTADEIGQAIEAFNRMATELRRSALQTEKYQMEAAVALEQAQAGSRAKSEFLATISHEIRTPLNGIMGGAQILLEQSPDNAEAAIIIRSGERLMTLLNDVLDFSKIEAGKLELAPAPTDLTALVEELLPLYDSAARARRVALRLERPDAPVWVAVDHNRVFQVITNLLSNAIKFSHDGGEVLVRLACDDHVADRVSAAFTVSDSGVGIPAEARAKLFTPFNQADRNTSIQYGGTGLGLVIVDRIVKIMGGSIDFTSQQGVGTTFNVRFVLDKATAPPRAVEANPARPTARQVYSHARVLVTEDDLVNRSVILSMLKRMGIVPDVAVDGREALDHRKRGDYDLVLMDHRMPVMDGVEATKAIRAHERETGARRIPIIAVSANTSNEDFLQFKAAGMDDLLKKPIRLVNLATVLSQWLSEDSGMRDLREQSFVSNASD